jgi:DNA topoisomerase-1
MTVRAGPPVAGRDTTPSRHRQQPEPNVLAARAAGLRHVDDRSPGFTRRLRGRRRGRRHGSVLEFDILDHRGRTVRDEAALDRIRKLAIPPAWTDVWICPDPRGHLQATGRDARRRKQYRYHPGWRQERDSTKYARMIEFGRALPRLRRAIAADLRLPGLPRRKVLATIVKLLETTFIRVGNEEYARENHSFGLTTLQGRHVDVGRTNVRFHFRGKSGVFHDVSLHDPAVARIVRRCRDLPGQELFHYLGEDGAPVPVGSADVNAYIHEIAGHDFTAKDFRTWAGTVLAAGALHLLAAGRSPRPGRDRRAGVPSRRPTNRDVVHAIEEVAARLGNTPAVCRKSYVHPHVVGAFLDGSLSPAFAHVTASSPRTTGLRADERAVLALLRSRASAERRGTLLETQLRRSLRRGNSAPDARAARTRHRGSRPRSPRAAARHRSPARRSAG